MTNRFQETLEAALAEQLNLKRNLKQKTGSAWDFETAEGTRIELKQDIRAPKTGNVFIEVSQSFDAGQTWRPSGISLAQDQAQEIWYILGDEPKIYVINPETLLNEAIKHTVRFTGYRVNGNAPGLVASGHLVPVAIFKSLCSREFNVDVKTI